jgi:hypothetical protein
MCHYSREVLRGGYKKRHCRLCETAMSNNQKPPLRAVFEILSFAPAAGFEPV